MSRTSPPKEHGTAVGTGRRHEAGVQIRRGLEPSLLPFLLFPSYSLLLGRSLIPLSRAGCNPCVLYSQR